MAKLFNQSKFKFVGEIMSAKEPLTTKRLSEKSEWFKTRLSIGIRANTDSQFLHMEYLHTENQSQFKMFDTTGQMFMVNSNETSSALTMSKVKDVALITVDLEEDMEKKKEYTSLIFKVRNHKREIENIHNQETVTDEDNKKVEELLSKIDTYQKQIDELATNRKQFAHMKDVMEYINGKLSTLAGKKLKVTGSVKCNFYNGKNTLQYVPNFIEIVPVEEESILLVTAEVFYDKEAVQDDTKEKKLIVNGYIGDRYDKQDKLFPIQVGLDYTAVDENNEEHMMYLNFMKDTFEIADKKQVYKTKILIKVINGAEKIEFSEQCLTERQKIQIAIGQKTLEDFRPKGNVYGDRIQELRFYEPIVTGAYENGSLEVFPVKELDDYLMSDDSDVKVDKVQNNEPAAEKAEDKKRQMMNALFK